MLERDYASAEKALNDFTSGEDKLKWGIRRKHFTPAGSRSPVATLHPPSVPLTWRCQFFQDRLRDEPDELEQHAELGLLYAYMRRDEDAIREARRAVKLDPESQNAFHGAIHAANLAVVYALIGEQEKAITLVERLLFTPGPVEFPIARRASHWPTFACAGSGTPCAAIRASRKSSPARSRRRSINLR